MYIKYKNKYDSNTLYNNRETLKNKILYSNGVNFVNVKTKEILLNEYVYDASYFDKEGLASVCFFKRNSTKPENCFYYINKQGEVLDKVKPRYV